MKGLTIYRLSDMTAIPSLPKGIECAVALGFFDGVHIGHAAVISAACSLCEHAAVWTIGSDDCSFAKEGGRITDDVTKLRLLRNAGVEYAAVSDFESVRDMTGGEFFSQVLTEAMGASAVVCGRDFRFGKGASSGAADLEQMCHTKQIKLKIVGDVTVNGERVSSTRIREQISSGDVAAAAKLLGRPYSLRSPIIHGKMLGRKLGYPTINQALPPAVLSPARGVYASVVSFTDKNGIRLELPGASNVGVCPTVSDGAATVCETHVIGYAGDLYGITADVTFLLHMRGERKFSGVEELKAQISADSAKAEEAALRYLNERKRK